MYFKKWPFAIVPEEHASVWADRHSLYNQMKGLFEGFGQKNNSFVQLLWGYLGAGKTHTLRHFQYALENKKNTTFVYSRFPAGARSFYELYRDGFVQSFNFGMFVKKCADIWKTLMAERGEEDAFLWVLDRIAHQSYDFAQVVYNLARLWSISPTEALRHPSFSLSRMWMQGARLGMRDMRQIGVTRNIKNDEDAVFSLGVLLRLLTQEMANNEAASVIWMLDDSQVILGNAAIQRGLRRTIDENPRRLLIIISFATTDPEKIRLGLNDELRTVCSPSLLEVPPLDKTEAFQFMVDLINISDFKEKSKDKFYPYTKEAIEELVKNMKDKGIDLLPRNMNRCADHVTGKAEKNSVERINDSYMRKFFTEDCGSDCPVFSE